MSISDINEPKIPFFTRFKNRFSLSLLSFPLNNIRCRALRLCSFKIGFKVYIGSGLTVASILGDKRCELEINDRVALGPNVTLLLSSDANWSKLNKVIEPIRGKIIIEKDCWIGANVVIMPNVTIGKCSVVGSGAVVTKDIPPYSVVAGVPAKVIRTLNKEELE